MRVAAPSRKAWKPVHYTFALYCTFLLLLPVSVRCDSGGITYLRLKGACHSLPGLQGVQPCIVCYGMLDDSRTSPHESILHSCQSFCIPNGSVSLVLMLQHPPQPSMPVADYAAAIFNANNPIVPALKTTERWFGPDHGVLQHFFLANSQPPARQDWQGWDATCQVLQRSFCQLWEQRAAAEVATAADKRPAYCRCWMWRPAPRHQ